MCFLSSIMCISYSWTCFLHVTCALCWPYWPTKARILCLVYFCKSEKLIIIILLLIARFLYFIFQCVAKYIKG
jgi:hypothetical protein